MFCWRINLRCLGRNRHRWRDDFPLAWPASETLIGSFHFPMPPDEFHLFRHRLPATHIAGAFVLRHWHDWPLSSTKLPGLQSLPAPLGASLTETQEPESLRIIMDASLALPLAQALQMSFRPSVSQRVPSRIILAIHPVLHSKTFDSVPSAVNSCCVRRLLTPAPPPQLLTSSNSSLS